MSGRWSAWGLVVLLGIIWVGGIQAAESDSLEGCRAQPFDAKMQCYQRHLETVLQAEGTEQALTVLEQITAQGLEPLLSVTRASRSLCRRSASPRCSTPWPGRSRRRGA